MFASHDQLFSKKYILIEEMVDSPSHRFAKNISMLDRLKMD